MPVAVETGLAAVVAGFVVVVAGLAEVWARLGIAADAKRRRRTGCFMVMEGSKGS